MTTSRLPAHPRRKQTGRNMEALRINGTEKRKRGDLSAEKIAAQALALIDSEGLDGFSYRTLAARLGCQAMSLYHYFPSKAHLFEALVDICISECPVPNAKGWRDELKGLCLAYRQVALHHPGFFPYFAIFRMNHRSGMAFLDQILRIFEATGLPPRERAILFRTISYYVTGAGLDESLGYAKGPSAVEPITDNEAALQFPSVMAVGPYFARSHHEEIFLTGLETLLDGVQAAIDRHAQTLDQR